MKNKTAHKNELMPLLEKVIKIQNRLEDTRREIRNSLPFLLQFNEDIHFKEAVEKVHECGVRLKYAVDTLHDIVLADSETRDAI